MDADCFAVGCVSYPSSFLAHLGDLEYGEPPEGALRLKALCASGRLRGVQRVMVPVIHRDSFFRLAECLVSVLLGVYFPLTFQSLSTLGLVGVRCPLSHGRLVGEIGTAASRTELDTGRPSFAAFKAHSRVTSRVREGDRSLNGLVEPKSSNSGSRCPRYLFARVYGFGLRAFVASLFR